jgi:hypothetical protein
MSFCLSLYITTISLIEKHDRLTQTAREGSHMAEQDFLNPCCYQLSDIMTALLWQDIYIIFSARV